MARKKGDDGGKDIGDVIFGDLMSQMLTFFILLYIFASQNISKTESNSFLDIVREGFIETLDKSREPPQPKKYNAERFFASLLSDSTFSDLMYSDVFTSVGLCLSNSSWNNLKGVLAKLVLDGKMTIGTVEAFKTKLFNEEGIQL